MFQKRNPILFTLVATLVLISLSCQTASDLVNPEPEINYETEVITKEVIVEGEVEYITETVVVTVEVKVTEELIVVTEIVIITEEPVEPEFDYPDTLVICLGSEPDSLFYYETNMQAANAIFEAIYDGPIDNLSFSFQPVILEKLPSLADGDAIIEKISVSTGDTVLVEGAPKTLAVGDKIRPAGCRSADCEVSYSGGNVEMDQLVVFFEIMPGLFWDDGELLTAYDSEFSYYVASNMGGANNQFLVDRTEDYKAMDDYVTAWVGIPGYFDPLYHTSFFHPLPAHQLAIFDPDELAETQAANQLPAGWGPYTIEEWDLGRDIFLTKNEFYHRSEEGLPYFDNLIFRFVGENTQDNIAALLAGECDIVDQTAHLDDEAELLLELQNTGQLEAAFVTSNIWEHLDFGINPYAYDDGWQAGGDRPMFFSDMHTRRAIALCLDRQSVVDEVMFGQSVVLDTYVNPRHPLFNPDAAHYDYDPEAGMALLEEVGWIDTDGDGIREASGIQGVPDGTEFEVDYWTTTATQRQLAAPILAENLEDCGIRTNLEYWNAADFFADGPDGPLFGRAFDLGQFAWLTSVEPPCDLYLTEQWSAPDNDWEGFNNPGYSNPEFDDACNAALSALPGEPGYEEYHLLAQEIFAEELPVVPLYLRLKLAATRPDFCGFIMDSTADSEMWNIEEFGYGSWCE